MSRNTTSFVPIEARQALRRAGAALQRARLARGDTQAVTAERAGVHVTTVARIERGDIGVAIGTVFSVFAIYNMADRLFSLSETDEATQLLVEKHLPRRGASQRVSRKSPSAGVAAATAAERPAKVRGA